MNTVRIIELSDGNPGAVKTLASLVKTQNDGEELLDKLTENGVRGPLVWVGYKDHCDRDIDVFADAIRSDDEEMYERINDYREKIES